MYRLNLDLSAMPESKDKPAINNVIIILQTRALGWTLYRRLLSCAIASTVLIVAQYLL